ncbi:MULTISPECIES: DUF4127 family protein [Actinomyces]|uniref:DUF4127 family protein n=1 Tax=Actinomyces respiraculi TaxID=2744574 RepID=A0A7T0LJN7_9ACTO|nr:MULTISPECIES: DUF4127 family protein [Actinomyces]QPL04646.1 DUF4127 family protein [Actinomyces respiraculi]
MHIVVIPLDERPVNTQIPALVASIGGASISLPPAAALPCFRTPADLDQLAGWVGQQARAHEEACLVVCTDTLVFGGIIPARINNDPLNQALGRLDLLRGFKSQHPRLRIIATSLVMRTSDTYSNQEEPTYWSEFGREFQALGADLHRSLELDIRDELVGPPAPSPVPAEVREDYEGRRLRNHMVNLAALDLVHEGVISALAVTADDTAYYSAGSAEQYWIGHWRRALPSLQDVLMYPGADEVGATMTARALVAGTHQPSVSVHCADEEGMLRIPSYENVPLSTSVEAQIRACDALPSTEQDADIHFVVHAPGTVDDDWWGSTPRPEPEAAALTARLVRDLLAAGKRVALADVRYTNGADPVLVKDLLADGTFWSLSAYGGWNTAGNTIGTVLATAVAEHVGTERGELDERARDIALWTRLLDDYLYQTRIRTDYYHSTGGRTAVIEDEETLTRIEAEVAATMREFIQAQPQAPGITLVSAALPWRRPFEVRVALR